MDDNKKVALNTTLKQIEKQFGKGAVMRLGDITALEVETVSTGSLGLDIALGVGGLPKGRVVEIYGPEASGKTTLTLQVAAEIQKQRGLVAFVDAEHALDSRYAERLGVNVSELYLAQPNNGEEALEITDTLVRSGAFDLVVVDSVAALTPKAEIEGDMGDSHMGLHARLMSQALRKLTANISRTNTLVIFINQIRMKIGVMFGCFDYETPVVLANGSRKPIGKIVTQKMPLEVLSYNRSTDTFEPRRIVNWYNNGETNTFLKFKVAAQGSSKNYQFACTPNHQLLTPTGYRAAGNMKMGDKLMTTVPFEIAPVREQIIWGLLLGDNDCDVINRHYRYNESLTEYQLWKQSLLAQPNSDEPEMSYLGKQECVAVLDSVLEKGDNDSKQNEYYPLIERLEPLAIAIWYMEHGYFDNKQGCCFIFNKPNLVAKQQAFVEWFKRRNIYPRFKGSYLWFNQTETAKLHEMIAPYLHPSRANKLSSNYRGRFTPLSTQPRRVWRAIPSSIIEIQKKSALQPRHRFDLEIEDNHNYVVDGVIVHNSPETTTGGNALKFYASVRLEIRRIGGVKRGEEIIGNETRVKIAKNKVAPPFKEAVFDILYGEGVSHESELLELGNQCNVIDKSGAWYSYKGSNLGQGKDNARLYLKEHPDLAQTIEEEIRSKLLPTKTTVPTPEVEKKSSEKNNK